MTDGCPALWRRIFATATPLRHLAWACTAVLLTACGAPPWNNPYPAEADNPALARNTLYSSFSQRPKHLDPAVSYASNEYALIANIYEPPLQYHYLDRPYRLVPLAAAAMPTRVCHDALGQVLDAEQNPSRVASCSYRVHIRRGMHYQPHPAFARDGSGEFRYHRLPAGRHYLPPRFPEQRSREVTAEDYVYQIKRLAHPQVQSPIYGLMSEVIKELPGLAKQLRQAWNALPRQDTSRYLDLRQFSFAGARVIDRYSYEITTNGFYPQMIYWLAMPFFAPMPWEADRFYSQAVLQEQNVTLDWFPVGSGPYMLMENDPNRRMVLVRNPNFHGERYPTAAANQHLPKALLRDAGKPLPFIDRVYFSLEPESIPVWNKFLQGYYDRAGIQSDSFDQAVTFANGGEARVTPAMAEKGIELTTSVATSTYYWAVNMLDPVVGGNSERARKLRQALSLALNVEEYIAIFRNGRGLVMQSPIPPGIFGHLDGEADFNPHIYTRQDGHLQRKPLAAARQLLVEAGYPNGRDVATGNPLTLYFDTAASGPEAKAQLDWLRRQFARLSIELVIRATDYNRFQDKVRTGKVQLFQWGWNADYPDPENFLFLFYGGNSRVLHGGENTANFQNSQFDALFERMKYLPDGPERAAVIQRMVRILRDQAPWIAGYHPLDYLLHHGWNKNLLPSALINNSLKYQRIDGRAREQLRSAWNRPLWWPLPLLVLLLLLALLPAWRLRNKRLQAGALTVPGHARKEP